jgi:hypothetical protein
MNIRIHWKLSVPIVLILSLFVGCKTLKSKSPASESVGTVPEAGVGTFGGPGAFGGGRKAPALPTAPGMSAY